MDKKAKMLSELEELKMAEKDSSTPAEALDGIREAITNLQKKIDGYKERKPKAKVEPKGATKTATVKKPRGAGKPNPDFAKVQQIAKNLKAKDPSLKHTKAVSMAWAEVRGGAPAKTTTTAEKAPEKKAEHKKLDKLKVTAKPKETAKKAVVKKASEAPKKKNDLIEKVKRAKAKVKRVGKTYSYKQNGEVRTFQRDKKKDGLRTAKHVGKRVSKEGNVYYEYRDNRADVNIGKVSYKRPSLYAKGGLAKIKIPTFTKSNEMSVLLAVYRSRIDGLNGSLEYFKSGASRYFHEQVRGNVSEEISRIKEKISEVENDIKFLQEEKYPIDIELGKYEATKFLNDLNNLVRTNSGRRLFNTDVEKLNEEYYSAYERVYDVLDSYVDSKYEITYAKGGETGKKYMVFNYTDNIYASPEVFNTKKEANEFIKSFRKRFEMQGYYRDNRMNKIDIEDIDLLAIPSDFSPFRKFAKGGTLDAYDQKAFKEWMDDGNVIKNPDGTYSTQDAQYQNRLESLTELKKYFKKEILEYAKGGSMDKTGMITLIFNGKRHKFEANFENGKVAEVFLPTNPDSELFQFIESQFLDWIDDNEGRDIVDMYYSEDAIYDKRGAIVESIYGISSVMEEGNLTTLNLDKDESDMSASWYAKGGKTKDKIVVKVRSTNYQNTLLMQMAFETERQAERFAEKIENYNDDRYVFSLCGYDSTGKKLVDIYDLSEYSKSDVKKEKRFADCKSWSLKMKVADLRSTLIYEFTGSFDACFRKFNLLDGEDLYADYESSYAKGGETGKKYASGGEYPKIETKEDIPFTKTLRAQVEHAKKYNPKKVAEAERKLNEWLKMPMMKMADGGEMDDENQRFDVNPNVTSTLANLQPYLDEYTMRKFGSKFPPETIFVEYYKRPDGTAQIEAVTLSNFTGRKSKRVTVDEIFETYARGGEMGKMYRMPEEKIVS